MDNLYCESNIYIIHGRFVPALDWSARAESDYAPRTRPSLRERLEDAAEEFDYAIDHDPGGVVALLREAADTLAARGSFNRQPRRRLSLPPPYLPRGKRGVKQRAASRRTEVFHLAATPDKLGAWESLPHQRLLP